MSLPTRSRVNLNVYGRTGTTSNKEYQGDKTEGYVHMLADFLNHVDRGTKPNLQLVEDTMLLIDALYHSTSIHAPVEAQFASLN